jgi:hypothetical protein
MEAFAKGGYYGDWGKSLAEQQAAKDSGLIWNLLNRKADECSTNICQRQSINELKKKKMNIKYKNYTLEPEASRYNLYKDVKRKIMKKGEKMTETGKFRTVKETMGYGMSFENCIETIIKDTLNSKKESLSLRQYIDEYKALHIKLLEDIK